MHKIFNVAENFQSAALLICQVQKCMFARRFGAVDGAPLAKAPSGTSPEHIWAHAPNNREAVSAKHHNKIVFLIKILFLP